MKLNASKTKMLCILAAKSYKPEAFFATDDRVTVMSSDSLRVLGFHFGTRPTVKTNMQVLQRKFKCRIWLIRHLKKNGFKQGELLTVYKTIICPVAEYCSTVYQALITDADTNELERIQMQALKCIYGWNLSYEKLLEKSGIEGLSVRREASFIKLAIKMRESARFASWFPLRLYRDGVQVRSKEKYKVYRANTGRCLNSPLNLMHQKLNEIESV